MVIPLPLGGMAMQAEPPSDFVLRLAPWMMVILLLQLSLCIYRFVAFLDIFGGFIMLITIGLGGYAWKQDMQVTGVCAWGLLCFVNGILDCVQLIDAAVHSPWPMFSGKFPFRHNFDSACRILIPISFLLGSLLAGLVYKDCSSSNGADGHPSEQATTTPLLSGLRSQPQAFSGSGYRLGST
mmetsp:Transcript_82936/g.130764  ORF Transcript_82936/g.130764 Transcript_82936/m.130764 type:complete len:182 (-) Transcript_82936:3-548(-)